jgi:N-acetyl-gamma-glutamyl-phosphate reductase
MIAEFEDAKSASYTEAPFFVYGLTLKHKHVPEIQRHGGLTHRPIFVPSVGRFAQGMIVQIPLQLWALPGTPTPAKIHQALAEHYAGCRFVKVAAPDEVAGLSRLEPESVNGTNELRLHVFGNEAEGQVVLMALLDNLGKGASGSTVQNMDIMLGLDEGAGLDG